jgi:hypothetical protein
MRRGQAVSGSRFSAAGYSGDSGSVHRASLAVLSALLEFLAAFAFALEPFDAHDEPRWNEKLPLSPFLLELKFVFKKKFHIPAFWSFQIRWRRTADVVIMRANVFTSSFFPMV